MNCSKLLGAAAIIASAVTSACTDPSTAAPEPQPGSQGPAVTSPPRGGALHLIARCQQYPGVTGSSCTIAVSNLTEIGVGWNIAYASAAGTSSLHSDVVLSPSGPGTDAAFGHCDVDRVTDAGQCTFWDGQGSLVGLRATVTVAYVGGNIWYWDGRYSLGQ